eukprot:jgi/Psemu1/305581/fgenesh1_kg.206_\
MCGLRRTRRIESLEKDVTRSLVHVSGHASGFRFLKFDEIAKCSPQANDVNFCGIFTGILYAYGKHQNEEETSRAVMSYVKSALDVSEPQALHSELAMISSIDEFSSIEGLNTNLSSTEVQTTGDVRDELSRLDTLLIIVSGLIFLAIIYYFYIQWDERRRYTNDRNGISSNLSIESEGKDFDRDRFVDEDLGFEPYDEDEENDIVFS